MDKAKVAEFEEEMENFEPDTGSEIWQPEEPGDYVVGEILSFQKNVGDYNSTLMTLETEDGEKGVWLKKVIRSQFKRKGVREGDTVGIKYDGKQENEKGTQEYDVYGVKVLERAKDNINDNGESEDEVVPF